MKGNKCFIIAVALITFLLGTININAENACSKAVTANGGKPTTYVNEFGTTVSARGCGDCGYAYAWKDGVCDLSEHDKELSENEECSQKATNSDSCSLCSGYKWDWTSGTCIPISRDPDASYTSCLSYTTGGSCISNTKFSCVWVDKKTGKTADPNVSKEDAYCNTDNLRYVKCGDTFDIPEQAPTIISFTVNLLKILTPIVLIIIGVITLVKSLMAEKEDEIVKARKSLVKKLIAAGMVFFIVSIVQFVILKFADNEEKENISDCLSCLLNNDCDESLYYKTYVGNLCYETSLKTGKANYCPGSVRANSSKTNTNTNTGTDNNGSTTHESSSGKSFSGGGGRF